MTSRSILLSGALALLALLSCTFTPGASTPPTVAPDLPARQVSTATPIGVYMLSVYGNGTAQLATLTDTPWPTFTPTASNTPMVSDTPVPSSTPLSPTPSVTPSPTVTPSVTSTPSHTPDFEDTPTPEDTRTPPVPTNTPTVTPSPTPSPTSTPDTRCWGTVTADALNVRELPTGDWRTATKIGTVGYGDILLFDAKLFNEFWWWRIEAFESVGDNQYIGGWVSTNYIAVGDTANCGGLEEIPLVAHNAALLWHTVPGFNVNNAQVSYEILRAKGIDFGLKTYAGMNECLDALVRGGICIYRHPNTDYPQNIGSSDPRASAKQYFQDYGKPVCNVLKGYDKAYWEVVNEPNLGGSQSDAALNIVYWWDEWTDQIITEAQAYGCPKLVLLTGGPGHGEPVQYRVWKTMLIRAASLGYLLGEHAYTPYHDGGLCECDEWLACRHRTNEAWRQAEGVDIDVAITEAARAWGGATVDTQDFICWYEEVRHDEFLHSVSLWLMGHHPTWPLANLDNYAVPIVSGVGS